MTERFLILHKKYDDNLRVFRLEVPKDQLEQISARLKAAGFEVEERIRGN